VLQHDLVELHPTLLPLAMVQGLGLMELSLVTTISFLEGLDSLLEVEVLFQGEEGRRAHPCQHED